MTSLANEGHFDVVYFFGDSSARNSSYQLIQWIQPLERVSEHLSVCVLLRDPALASHIPPGSPLILKVARSPRQIEDFLQSVKPSMVLYSNHMPTNFFPLGFNEGAHIFINHGESDKPYNSELRWTAFDFLFVPGELRKARVTEEPLNFPPDRVRCIGRPQLLDKHQVPDKLLRAEKRLAVIYAPTYEGYTTNDGYGSLVSHGMKIISSVLESPQLRLIYRPHPLTGQTKAEWATAHRLILKAIAEANSKDQAADHIYDNSPWGWQLGYAEAMVSDVSSVAYDWLGTGKPLVITEPADPRAKLPLTGFFSDVILLDTAAAPFTADVLSDLLQHSEANTVMAEWSSKYFSPNIDPVTGEEVFVQELKAIKTMVQQRRTGSEQLQPAPTQPDISRRSETLLRAEKVSQPQSSGGYLNVLLKREVKKKIYPTLRRVLTRHLLRRTTKLAQKNRKAVRPIIFAAGRGATPRRVMQAWKFVAENSINHGDEQPVIAFFSVKGFLSATLLLPFASKLAIRPRQTVFARTDNDFRLLTERNSRSAVFYNQLAPANHGLLTVSGPEHILLWPERDHAEPTHNLVAFDQVVCDSSDFTKKTEQHVFWLHPARMLTSKAFLSTE